MKKILYRLQQWDVVWSAPLSFLLFVACSWGLQWLFGESVGFYDPGFWQAGIYAIGMVVLINGSVWMGMWFNYRTVYRYYTKKSKSDFENLQPWQRLFILFASYWLYFAVTVFVWAKLV